jgi:hypothetical protein
MAGHVAQRGRDLDLRGIATMYVDVDLDPDVQRRLSVNR